MAGPAQPDPPPPGPGAVVAVGAVVVDAAGRLLLVRRGRPPMVGAWTLPGGRVEAGEGLEGAVVREVLEETAVHARAVCALGPVPVAAEGRSFVIHEFLLVPTSGAQAVRAADDAADARWVTPNELEELGVAEAAHDVARRGLAEARARGFLQSGADEP